MKIYTRTGDSGDTGLFGGGRVPKDDRRVTAYGDVDELNAVLGVAIGLDPVDFNRDLLESIQRDLFSVGGRLATPKPEKVSEAIEKAALPDERIGELETAIDDVSARLEPLQAFILPGGTQKASALHLARTVCRRAERSVVALNHREEVPPFIIRYLNRLSDLLFVLARLANSEAGIADREW
ncbi:MAG: cob(I)yrinic acid a,c-diamide adenosyltransferase [Gemmatimonadota bacterium]|nr:cob(I)yrinic acid a,c-diamide adenosyltransferase [Gemmatimonadota bacterium]